MSITLPGYIILLNPEDDNDYQTSINVDKPQPQLLRHKGTLYLRNNFTLLDKTFVAIYFKVSEPKEI